ncbi:MAG: diphthine--ammonia ligase [Candidatus Methanomethylicia archaeon]|jgi:ABC transporter with metal-binding/Fe-S-binding domain ATP-binding protein|nr:diphthine--ammonia ligase [Candidatus Methanomethylicia archaeon]
MRLILLYSGGKDSNLALYKLINKGYKVDLLTIIPKTFDSWMFHRPNVEFTKVQAECMELNWQSFIVSGEKDKEIQEIIDFLKDKEIDGIVAGAIKSRYQKEKIEYICDKLNVKPIFPLWGLSEMEILNNIIELGFEVYFSCVAAEGFGKEWLGRKLDLKAINELIKLKEKYGISIVGEGGEYETFVCDSPLFKKRIKVTTSEIVWHRNYGYWFIKNYELISKN